MKEKEEDVFRGYGIRISLKDPVDFLKVKETLTRMGSTSDDDTKKLYQACHIFHKRGSYAIMHYKELFAFDGVIGNVDVEDIAVRNLIVRLLGEWGLVKIEDEQFVAGEIACIAHIGQVKIVAHREKNEWSLVSKYEIGRRGTKNN
jgi:hypothetical protein